MIRAKEAIVYTNTEVVYGGVRIYKDPISLRAMLEKLRGLGITNINHYPLERGAEFGVWFDLSRPEERDSIFYYDSLTRRRLLVANVRSERFFRGFLEPDGVATYEAELVHAGDPEKRKLIICTNGIRLPL